MKKITTGVLILVIAIVVLIFQYINGDGPFKKSSTDVRGESYLVKRVIDGDTII
ncbi:thermonuclease, partial [Staphylococcus pseudintermedius]